VSKPKNMCSLARQLTPETLENRKMMGAFFPRSFKKGVMGAEVLFS